jgi:hypothetical protein
MCNNSKFKEDMQRTHNVTMKDIHVMTVAMKQQYILNVMSVFVALVTQHAKCMHHTTICGLAIPYFSTLSHKWRDFQKKNY